MAVKLELYRIFRTVAEEESISAAAKTLFISQSAVSPSISWRNSCRYGCFPASPAVSP